MLIFTACYELWEVLTTTRNVPVETTLVVAFFSSPTPFLAVQVYVPGSLSSADRTRFSLVPRITFPRYQVMFGLGSPIVLQVSSTLLFSLSVNELLGRVVNSGSPKIDKRLLDSSTSTEVYNGCPLNAHISSRG